MVLSKINKNVSYKELKRLEPEDLKKEKDLYEIQLKNIDVVVAIGNPQYSFIQHHIIYFPLYLVKYNDKVLQIGVYEIESELLIQYLDEEGNLDVSKTDDPLLYTFVTESMLLNTSKKVEKEEETKKEDETEKEIIGENEDSNFYSNKPNLENNISENRKDIFTLDTHVKLLPLLKTESKKDAKKLQKHFIKEEADVWMEIFMKNNHYFIIDNEGNGDCLFATIRDAFSQLGQITTVPKLREKLSKEANDSIFINYKEHYNMYLTTLNQDDKTIKELKTEYENLKEKYKNMLDRTEKEQLMISSKLVRERHDQLVKEKAITKKILKEFSFMKNIDTLEKFKKLVRSCEFWAETWAISTLERILNIKIIIFSSEAFQSKPPNLDNILLCGQLNDTTLEDQQHFDPEFYILVDYTGSHYKLIGYKKKKIFKFEEIPFSVKEMIVEKCMERVGGVYNLIPDFQLLKKQQNNELIGGSKEGEGDEMDAKLTGLYDENIVFQFYSKSGDKDLPGKGQGEQIPQYSVKDYSELALIPHWRQKLDDSWSQSSFTFDNHRWSSVEHLFQASKFKKGHPEYYLTFSLDSDSELSKDVDMAKQAGSKRKKNHNSTKRKRDLHLEIDPDFYGKNSQEIREKGQEAKFKQNDDLSKMLNETHQAKLMHHRKGKEPETCWNLMKIRKELKIKK